MTALPLGEHDGGARFPGFDVAAHAEHWDEPTRETVLARLRPLAKPRFFSEKEQDTASALFDQLLYQPDEPRVPVMSMVDARIAAGQTDGWHYQTMPPDAEAWRKTLAALDDDSGDRFGHPFAECDWDQQTDVLRAIHELGTELWHGMSAQQVWSLWTRYACTAFYSHPLAWNEIGFDGPAYPRGYKNLGVDRLEGFEVHDAHPADPIKPDAAKPNGAEQDGAERDRAEQDGAEQ